MQNVKVVAVSEPHIVNDGGFVLTVDEFIAYVARVSNPSNQMNTATAPKLLKYLAKHKHWSPFEMVSICMEIETTRDIARQILRHRSFSFQEFSQRYADPTQDLGFVTREARLQDTKNRQNSIETSDEVLQRDWEFIQETLIDQTKYAYKWAIRNGIAKEQARAVLPEGLILSRMYMAGSLRSWIHYCQVRMDQSTQKEHREIAEMAWTNILFYFPSLSEVIIDS
jgi:thymidylate synthase (FAD)